MLRPTITAYMFDAAPATPAPTMKISKLQIYTQRMLKQSRTLRANERLEKTAREYDKLIHGSNSMLLNAS